MVPQDAPLASELVLDILGKRGQTRTRPRRRSEAVSSAGGDRGDGASPLQRHRIEEVALVAASMRYEGGRNAGGAFEGGGEQVREINANLEISILHHLWISGTN